MANEGAGRGLRRLAAAVLLALLGAAGLAAQAPRELVGKIFHRGPNEEEIAGAGHPPARPNDAIARRHAERLRAAGN